MTIQWEKYTAGWWGPAGDGQEGMKLIREKRPDILISDICMPGIDGLTMIAGMKSEFGPMQITILTASAILTMPSRPAIWGLRLSAEAY